MSISNIQQLFCTTSNPPMTWKIKIYSKESIGISFGWWQSISDEMESELNQSCCVKSIRTAFDRGAIISIFWTRQSRSIYVDKKFLARCQKQPELGLCVACKLTDAPESQSSINKYIYNFKLDMATDWRCRADQERNQPALWFLFALHHLMTWYRFNLCGGEENKRDTDLTPYCFYANEDNTGGWRNCPKKPYRHQQCGIIMASFYT